MKKEKVIDKSNMVTTPEGLTAHICGRETCDGGVCVVFSKADYTDEEWLAISPGNGPCAYRMYNKDELKESEEK